MTVWVVTRNKKVDAVFSSYEAAICHRLNLTNLWAITEIIEKEVLDI